MTQDILRQILDYSNRADPYPLYKELRRTPVYHDGSGPFVVSTYYEIQALLHDPRISSDARNLASNAADPLAEPGGEEETVLPPSFLKLDPPEHDRLRRMTNRPFGPPHSPHRVHDMRGDLHEIVKGLIDRIAENGNAERIDLVEEFSYPFPVTVICRLLGVPPEDEARFHVWADTLAASLDPDPDADPKERERRTHDSRMELGMYLSGLIEERRKNPTGDMLSELATGNGPDGTMTTMEVLSTAALLLIAGHETTVNLITNGMLTLLRFPEVLDRLREEPELSVNLVEELLRYEPPVQLVPQRSTLADIEVAGVSIPKGASLWLVLAAGNRDPLRFEDPDRFDPDREDIQHLGLGSGIHSCFGAPLARQEAQLALSELARRLENPRLLADPPPYRQNAVLRGPRHLPIAVDGIRP
ncbi:cytochrome P450 [Streptomyces lavendulae]|uniref:Cytochrome P450 107B1 n=1 Tax=Streptomyces lavendulae subsp. lavendulae TaxID=58340 RepID=A0A2K8PBR2_STRLA|nr:cytochrome P450 [Streptomyces lavendulae]ATZ24182.1 Cytochrome P450 107B1 [Streptomyces lavendulae subsp. lavendulae]QUQ54013.1 Cytochrome P450 monooxygenase PikC [Streptomyces lavendulae subsp. lavendulae]